MNEYKDFKLQDLKDRRAALESEFLELMIQKNNLFWEIEDINKLLEE